MHCISLQFINDQCSIYIETSQLILLKDELMDCYFVELIDRFLYVWDIGR